MNLAFYKDEKLSIPAFFIRDNGKTLTIDTAAFSKTNIEYAVLSGDINVKATPHNCKVVKNVV